MTANDNSPVERENVADLDVEHGPSGATRFKTHEYRPRSHLETTVEYDDSIFQATGTGFDDEPGHVEIQLFGKQFSFEVSLSPPEAAEFARELEAAAVAVEEVGADD